MKNIKRYIFIFLVMVLSLNSINMMYSSAKIDFSDSISVEPALKNGKKHRIGYFEMDDYYNYTGTFYGILKGLDELGWLENIDKMPYRYVEQLDTKAMWNWLVNNYIGEYIEFAYDAHYRLIDDEKKISGEVKSRLSVKKDLDLMIVMGTSSGVIASEDNYYTNTMIFVASDPIESGIINSIDDSGRDNIWAWLTPNRVPNQLEVFYDMFKFKKLGIVYEKSENGKNIINYNIIKEFSDKKYIDLVEYYVDEAKNKDDMERYYKELEEAYKNLSKEVDAVYITYGPKTPESISNLIKPLNENNIPTFSQQGFEEVKHGTLLSVARADFIGIGRFGANNIAKVLNGAKPRQLNQVYDQTPNITINMDTANEIGYKPLFDILLVADEIYRKNIK